MVTLVLVVPDTLDTGNATLGSGLRRFVTVKCCYVIIEKD